MQLTDAGFVVLGEDGAASTFTTVQQGTSAGLPFSLSSSAALDHYAGNPGLVCRLKNRLW